MTIKKIYLATQNKGKAEELKSLIKLPGWDVEGLSLSLDEIQSLDILEVASFKMNNALQQARDKSLTGYVLIDDTSLEIEALNGLPGTLIKWFLARLSSDQISKLKAINGESARAICMLGLGNIETNQANYFRGETLGLIKPAKLIDTFGWDDIFYPLGKDSSYAALPKDIKNRISHRQAAARSLVNHLRSQAEGDN